MGHFSTLRRSFRYGAGEESARRGLLLNRTFGGGRSSSSLRHTAGAMAAVGRAASRSCHSSTATGCSRSPPGVFEAGPALPALPKLGRGDEADMAVEERYVAPAGSRLPGWLGDKQTAVQLGLQQVLGIAALLEGHEGFEALAGEEAL